MRQLPNLTSLRFFLAATVVLYHVPQFFQNRKLPFFDGLPLFHRGTEAVYMFFSLSGFLIIRLLVQEKISTGRVNLRAFYMRRMLRIFPVYYLVLVIGFLYYQLIIPYLGFNFENHYPLWKGILLSATFFPNVFATMSPGGILEILWSIGVEEQFYLLVAPAVFFISVRHINLFLSIFSVLIFALYFSNVTAFLSKYHMLFFFFSFSGLCALLMQHKNFSSVISKLRWPLLLLLFLYFTTDIFPSEASVPYIICSTVLFGLSLCALSAAPIRILENSALKYLGKISYGIYMYHAVVMQPVGFIMMRPLILDNLSKNTFITISFAATLLLAIIAAHFSYQYYEKFFLNLKSRFKTIA